MQTVESIAQARAVFEVLPRPLGFIPTMGALHAGHLALVERARSECATVAASIFVNPLQFGPGEDFATYPRDLAADRGALAAAGTDVIFAPNAATMYPDGFGTSIDVGAVGERFEGAIRPHHFRGVATVVAKLLHIVEPDLLYLGQKDAQQTAVVRRLVRDLAFAVNVNIVPTVREADGLALSSRNVYLNERERAQAPSLHRALLALREALARGCGKAEAVACAGDVLDPAAKAEYFDVVHAQTFEPLDALVPPAFIIGAARFGTTRLIDNLWIER